MDAQCDTLQLLQQVQSDNKSLHPYLILHPNKAILK